MDESEDAVELAVPALASRIVRVMRVRFAAATGHPRELRALRINRMVAASLRLFRMLAVLVDAHALPPFATNIMAGQ
jgi:hypothetical protein